MAAMQIDAIRPDDLDNAQLRALVAQLSNENRHQKLTIDKLTFEMATLKRMKFARRSEAFAGVQPSLLDEDLDADLHAIAAELEPLIPERIAASHKNTPRRAALPPELPRREVRHEPIETLCLRLRTTAHRRGHRGKTRLRTGGL
jgi:transposase